MAHGYEKGEKYRGGSNEKRQERIQPKDSKYQDSRKSHDTKRDNQKPPKFGK